MRNAKNGALLSAAVIFFAVSALALQQPLMINFQGKLINPTTNNPQSGTFGMTFKIYNVAAGGVSLYSETQPAVTVTNGVFSAQIGSVTGLSRDLFLGATAYLGVTITGDAAGEMAPRQQLVMSPYAFTANQLSDNTEVRLIAGVTYSTFTSAGNLTVPAGVNASSGAFANGVTASSGTFTAIGAGQFSIAASSGIVMSAGELQIGASPSRVISDDATNAATQISSNVVIVGNLSAANFNMVFIASATLAAAANALTVNIQTGYNYLNLQFGAPGVSAATTFQLRFNGDAAADYTAEATRNQGGATAFANATAINLFTANLANPCYCFVNGVVIPNVEKFFSSGCTDGTGTAAPAMEDARGMWNNNTSWVTSITLQTSNAATFNAGTTMRVFGSR